MSRDVFKSVRIGFLALFVAVAMSACGGSDDKDSGATATVAAETSAASAGEESGGGVAPDACTFFSKEELQTATGAELEDGDEQMAEDGGSACRFSGDPNVTINTYVTNEDDFSAFRDAGASSGTVEGLGDDAFWIDGADLLHVRVGDTAFSIRINDDLGQIPDVRNVVLELANSGVQKLS